MGFIDNKRYRSSEELKRRRGIKSSDAFISNDKFRSSIYLFLVLTAHYLLVLGSSCV